MVACSVTTAFRRYLRRAAGRALNPCSLSVFRKVSIARGVMVRASGKHLGTRDCIGCHMPKRRTDDAVHVVMTDHYIQRRQPPRDLLAPISERRETEENSYRGEVVLYYPRTLGNEPDNPDRDLYL